MMRFLLKSKPWTTEAVGRPEFRSGPIFVGTTLEQNSMNFEALACWLRLPSESTTNFHTSGEL